MFVDLDAVPLLKIVPTKVADLKPDLQNTGAQGPKTIPGEASTDVENLRADEKVAIRKEVEKETNDAIGTISVRLQDYYSREIDDFYRKEFARIAPLKQSQTASYLNAIRAIFEASAKKRGPLLTRLSFLTGFPPPEKLIPIEGENLTKKETERRTEIRELQRSIAEIDQQYEADTRKLETDNADKLEKETENIQVLLQAKQKEIDQRAEKEASQLVRRFTSSLSQRIFSRYTFQLKEIPTKTVNFPKMDSPSEVPRVTFDEGQANRGEKAELANELATFLSLNHYQRAVSPIGAKDVTKEFIEWRTNLKSGHWENWQKSSTQK